MQTMEVICSSGMSDVSSHSPTSETIRTNRCLDYSGCHGYRTTRSGATSREATEDECCGDVSSTEVTSERSHRTLNSDLVAAAKSVCGVASRGRPGSSSDMSRMPSVEADMSDSDVVQKRRKLTDTGFSEDEEQMPYMSVVWSGGRLGVAYYSVESREISMMLDATETDDMELLRKVCQQVEPCCVVVSSKQDERVINMLKQIAVGSSDEASPSKDFIQFLPSVDFSLDICKRRLLMLSLPSIPQGLSDCERTLHISSLVPFENVSMVRAVGGLLKLLDKKRAGVELEDVDVQVPVLSLRTFSLNDLLIVDDISYRALQLFQREAHPSVYKAGIGNSGKEGLSLYGILNRCKSQIGSKMLRLWFMRPLRHLDQLTARQDAIAFFMNPRHVDTVSTLQNCLKHIRNTSKILIRMTQAQASVADWQVLYKTVYNATYMGEVCRSQRTSVPIFQQVGHMFTEDLQKITNLIGNIVDFDESAIANRFVVKPNVDAQLDEKKRNYNGLPDFMTKIAREELEKLTDDVQECSVIYMPQLGYMLAVPLTESLRQKGDYTMPGLDFMFFSNETLYYKSAKTRSLDEMLGDTQCDVNDHEIQIMHRLQDTILEHCQCLVDVTQYMAELDCLIALAVCAREGNYCRPQLTSDSVINIKAGRHPLQELCCSPFVPNDTRSGGSSSRMKLLSGPNTSGKSIYLKQVAVIVFMAHIGSYVPAETAVIGLTDRIFTRIRTLESVSVGLSTFMIDLNQVCAAVQNATANSLVILDEFGKGTHPADGEALLCACLRRWLTTHSDSCPHVFVSTHFHGTLSHLPKSPLLSCQTMEVMQDGSELVFLYQLIDGSTNYSYACKIAANEGLPAEIVKRGTQVSQLLMTNESVCKIDSASTAKQYEKSKKIIEQFMSLDLDKDDLQAFLKDVIAVNHPET